MNNTEQWTDIQIEMPTDDTWVIVLAELLGEPVKGMKVAFQAKHDSHVGWSDWCGDLELKDGWKVIGWLEMPDIKSFIEYTEESTND